MVEEFRELLGVGSLSMVDRYTRSLQISNDAVIERGPNLNPTVQEGLMTGTIESTLENHRTDTKSSSPSSSQNDGNAPTWADLGGLNEALVGCEDCEDDAANCPEKQGVLTGEQRYDILNVPPGEVAEWLNAPVSKTGLGKPSGSSNLPLSDFL